MSDGYSNNGDDYSANVEYYDDYNDCAGTYSSNAGNYNDFAPVEADFDVNHGHADEYTQYYENNNATPVTSILSSDLEPDPYSNHENRNVQ